MLRILFALVIPLAACDSTVRDPPYTYEFDSGVCTVTIGDFQLAAPRSGLHYDKALDVVVDETELWALLTVRVYDDGGHVFAPSADTTMPYPQDAGSWWNRDTFHFELAANTRYTASVSACDRIQTVEFFTSPE